MDDCGDYEILPGVFKDDTTSYEFRNILTTKLDEFCETWNKDKGYWTLQGLHLEYFDFVFCPFVVHIEKAVRDLYAKKYSPNYIQISDPVFNVLLDMNIRYMQTGKRGRVLLAIGEQSSGTIKINFDIGIGQFIPFSSFDMSNDLYIRECEVKESVGDGQYISCAYDGNYKKWSTIKILNELEEYTENEWPIIQYNKKLQATHTCISTLDVFQRLLLVADLCKNVDFYFWLGEMNCVWPLWSEVSCDCITLPDLTKLTKYVEENAPESINLEGFLGLLELINPTGSFKRSNVYLGFEDNSVKRATAFASFVSNGIFTLSKESV